MRVFTSALMVALMIVLGWALAPAASAQGAASGAPTMGGSYATAALNIGAAAGPVLGAFGLATGLGLIAPIWVASVLTAIALVIMLLTGRARTNSAVEANSWIIQMRC